MLARPQLALANHLIMGPVILARALAGTIPYAVKVHGSALEYTVKPEPERFLALAREGLAPARAVLVGSRHTALSLWQTLADPELPGRTRLGPPGVDVARFAPRGPGARPPACTSSPRGCTPARHRRRRRMRASASSRTRTYSLAISSAPLAPSSGSTPSATRWSRSWAS